MRPSGSVRALDGNFCTPVQGAMLRLPFRGFITTNYDPGLIRAGESMGPDVASTSYSTWMDQETPALRWASGDVFKGETCPVFFAHGSLTNAARRSY